MNTNRGLLVLALTVVMAPGPGVLAQSVAARTPNLQGTWTAPKGVVQFNFLHRFSISDAPFRKVTNTPTFHVGTGLTQSLMVGFTYGSNSALVPAFPNEWEFFARVRPLTQATGAPLDLSIQGGYNVASESVDGEVVAARALGRLRLLGVARAFSAAYAGEDARYAVAAGASLSLTRNIPVGGDWGTLINREDDEPYAWSAGLQMGVPFTPHSFSIHASNVGTASLEGASRGQRTRWGFEYTIPITLRRFTSGGASTAGASADPMLTPTFQHVLASGYTVVVDIQEFGFSESDAEIAPGTTVVWRNRDPVRHSVTSDGGRFHSGLIDPGAVYALTFPNPGVFPFHCTPHPEMTSTVLVSREPDTNGPR